MLNMNDNYNNIKHIYTSKNSKVYTAVNKLTDKPVVLKSVNESMVDEYGFAKLQNEYNILSKIRVNLCRKQLIIQKLAIVII